MTQDHVQVKAQQASEWAQQGGRAVGQEVQKTWLAASLGQKMVLAGGVAGFIAFFLPWQSMAILWARAHGSGFTIARMGYTAYWLYPLMMAGVVFLAWLRLHGSPAQQARASAWTLTVGTGWTFYWVIGVLFRGDTALLWGGGISLLACITVWVGSVKMLGAAVRSLEIAAQEPQ